jgi:hypothetical protein
VNGCDGARRATETTPVTLKHPHRTYPTGGESMLPYASRAACGCSSQPISALARCWGWGILHDDAWIEISRIGFHGRHTVLLRTVRVHAWQYMAPPYARTIRVPADDEPAGRRLLDHDASSDDPYVSARG